MSNVIHNGSKAAVIAGTGFEDAFGSIASSRSVETPYGDITVSSVRSDGEDLYFLPRHGKFHSVPPHRINYRAHISALKQLGVTHILATAAAGSLRADLLPGEIVVLNDFIDHRGETTTFFDGADGDVQHTDFTEPFSESIRRRFLVSSDELNANSKTPAKVHSRGVYLCTAGPRYETPAEVRLYSSWGADVVGMTVAPEAILSREAGIQYAAVAVVTNLGTGLSLEKLSHAEVNEQMQNNLSFLVSLFRTTVSKLFDSIDT